MTYGGQFLKFTFLFHIDGTDEIADTSINYSNGFGWTGAVAALAELSAGDLNDMQDLMVDLLQTTSWADYSRLDGVKAAAISTAGAYLDSPLIAEQGPSIGSETNVVPQCSCVVSLRSGLTLGVGNFGRMYLPHTRMDLASGFPITGSTVRDAIAAQAVTTINGWTTILNAAITPSVVPVIMSQAAGTPTKVVTEVRVGGVNDTQRRRRNQLDEVYSIETL
jgi:hypothetical protein